MMQMLTLSLVLLFLLASAVASSTAKSSSIFDFKANDISGKPLQLSQLKGKKAYLVVNVASK
jgi:glutathione peroxidase